MNKVPEIFVTEGQSEITEFRALALLMADPCLSHETYGSRWTTSSVRNNTLAQSQE